MMMRDRGMKGRVQGLTDGLRQPAHPAAVAPDRAGLGAGDHDAPNRRAARTPATIRPTATRRPRVSGSL